MALLRPGNFFYHSQHAVGPLCPRLFLLCDAEKLLLQIHNSAARDTTLTPTFAYRPQLLCAFFSHGLSRFKAELLQRFLLLFCFGTFALAKYQGPCGPVGKPSWDEAWGGGEHDE